MARDPEAERIYQDALDNLRILAQQDLADWWADTDGLDYPLREESMLEAFDYVQRAYGEQAAYAAADYLFVQRSLDKSLAGLEYPTAAEPASYEQAKGSFRWATSQWRTYQDETSLAAAKRRLSGVLNRLVAQPAHETVSEAALAAGTGFARVPEPGACDFCLMLASRGAAYTRESVGRSKKFHDNCRCLGIEVQNPSDLPQINRELGEIWQATGNEREFYGALKDRRSAVQLAKQEESLRSAVEDPVDYLNGAARSVIYTEAEKSAIHRWQGMDRYYQKIQAAAEGTSTDARALSDLDLLDTAAGRMRIDSPVITWRGVRNVEAAIGKPIDQVEPGDDLTSTRFTAVSTNISIAKEFTAPGKNPAIFRVKVGEGTPGIWMPTHGRQESEYREQEELLLPPDVTMRIVEISETDDGIPVIHVEVSP